MVLKLINHILNFLYTVDVEVSPSLSKKVGTQESYRRCIFGDTPRGSFGLPFQLDTLNQFGLKATFFVEPLFALGGHEDYLKEIIDLILSAGQDVQLHLHPEWLKVYGLTIQPENGLSGANMSDYSAINQRHIIDMGLEAFKRCHIDGITAFRAGNYGANFVTLQVLKENGIIYDTSYNYPYLESDCGLKTLQPLVQPQFFEGVCEVPVSYFEQFPGSFKHTQVLACSFSELAAMMGKAWQKKWFSFVVVSHSFELINRALPSPNKIAIKRFEKLCSFVSNNPDRYKSKSFSNLCIDDTPLYQGEGHLKSNPIRTIARYAEQFAKRVFK